MTDPRTATGRVDPVLHNLHVNDGTRTMINATRLVVTQMRTLIADLRGRQSASHAPHRAVAQMPFTDLWHRRYVANIVIEADGEEFIDFRGEFEGQDADYGLRIEITDIVENESCAS